MDSDKWRSLIERMRGGDQGAAAEFANWFAPRILSFFLSRYANDAESLGVTTVSDLTMAVLDPKFEFLGERALLGFAFTIARRTLTNHLRGNDPQVAGPLPEELPLPERELGNAELAAAVFEAIDLLPAMDRAIFIRRAWDELEFADIGTEVEMAEGTARVRHHRLLIPLRDRLLASPAVRLWLGRLHLHPSVEEMNHSTT